MLEIFKLTLAPILFSADFTDRAYFHSVRMYRRMCHWTSPNFVTERAKYADTDRLNWSGVLEFEIATQFVCYVCSY